MKKLVVAALLVLGVCAWTEGTVSAAGMRTVHVRSAKAIVEELDETLRERDTDEENVSIANPFTDCVNLDEARAVAGFDMKAPGEIGIYDKASYTAIKGYLLQIQYAADENRYICVRKAAGSGDISGDWNVYAREQTKTVGTKTVVMKGNGGQVSLATWTEGGYTYSVGVYDIDGYKIDGTRDAGLSEDEMTRIIAQIQ